MPDCNGTPDFIEESPFYPINDNDSAAELKTFFRNKSWPLAKNAFATSCCPKCGEEGWIYHDEHFPQSAKYLFSFRCDDCKVTWEEEYVFNTKRTYLIETNKGVVCL